MQKIVVLGGGTAGWLTALLAQRYLPDASVTLVESEEIGILGAGEGTSPDFMFTLQLLGIDPKDIITECDGTLKLGIQFDHWNGVGTSYYHVFEDLPYGPHHSMLFQVWNRMIKRNMPVQQMNLAYQLARVGKTPLAFDDQGNMVARSIFAMHFNASKLAVYLKKIALQRGVVRIEGKIQGAVNHADGDIRCLVMQDGSEVEGSFFFDCSGFARLLIGKHYNTKWRSFIENLPMKKAIPFFIERGAEENTIPLTGAIAMKYGWIWQIPVKGRYGAGYVFDSDYISDDQALHEAEQYYGCKLNSPRAFKFEAGAFEDTLVNNCMSSGLSQGFIEPLEATSIWMFCSNLKTLFDNKLTDKAKRTPTSIRLFNQLATTRVEDVVHFVHMHYQTKRDDSPFWNEFKQKTKTPPFVQDRLNMWKSVGINWGSDLTVLLEKTDHQKLGFDRWVQVGDGLGLINPDAIDVNDDKILDDAERFFTLSMKNRFAGCLTYKQFLEHLDKFDKNINLLYG